MKTLTSHNPAIGETVWSGSVTAEEDVHAAATYARAAQVAWARLPVEERIEILRTFASLASSRVDDLASMITREAGKLPSDAKAEAGLLAKKVDATIEAWHDRQREPFDVSRGVVARLRYKPIGTLAVFGPFNFPMHLPNGHLVPALLTGNAVVFKPSDHTPGCGEMLASLFHEAGVPADVLKVVQGGRETGEALVDSDIDGVLFTGSEATGEAIAKQLRYDQMLALELGGNNPLVVHDPADVNAAIDLVIQSAYVSAGQRCTCARRLIVTDGVPMGLVDKLADAVRQVKVGTAAEEPEPMVGPLISEEAAWAVLSKQESLVKAGADPIRRCELDLSRPVQTLVRPGLIDVTDVETGDEEVFGPLLQLTRVTDLDAAIRLANDTRFGLAAGIVCRSRDDYEAFVSGVDAGCINWNRPLTGASGALPFGGVGRSGNHRPAGSTAINYCMTPVASLESESS
jgi:succinylglutamic semialdehyde dehydrogenase